MEENKTNIALFDKAVLEGKVAWWEMLLPSKKVFFSENKTNMLGLDEKDFKTYEDFTNIVHPDDHDKIMKEMRDHLEGKKDFYEALYRIKNSSGEYIKFYDCGQITKKEGDKITVNGFVMKVEDEEKLKQEMEKFKEMILKGKPSIIDLIVNLK